ncbi:MAG TPA: RluA family pseudouridine synthase [Thermoanaerobaculia bacterium]|nr:RluA family pseudouridine synthase [Thermoanaerobaculia bacterium]
MAAQPDFRRAFRADRGDARRRLDHVLLRHLADLSPLSRSRIQDWIAAGLVRINGLPAAKPASRIGAGDEVEVALPAAARPAPPPLAAQDIPLAVLYEDAHLLAIDKPAGLVVHPAFGHRDGTLINALLWRARGWDREDACRPGLVNRLDRDTTGVVLVIKSRAAHAGLARAIKSRSLAKEYLAVVYGRPPLPKGRIDLNVLRDPRDRRRMTTSRSEGRAAATLYELLAESSSEKAGLALLRCRLVTGRTHQIRVHLAARRLPIVGDPLYGQPRWKGIADPALAALCRDFPRQALHASRLRLRHPVTGAALDLAAPLPPDLDNLLAAAGLNGEVWLGFGMRAR